MPGNVSTTSRCRGERLHGRGAAWSNEPPGADRDGTLKRMREVFGEEGSSERAATDITLAHEQDRARPRVSDQRPGCVLTNRVDRCFSQVARVAQPRQIRPPSCHRRAVPGTSMDPLPHDVNSRESHSRALIYQPSLQKSMIGTVRAMMDRSRETPRVLRYSRSNSTLRRTSSTEVS